MLWFSYITINLAFGYLINLGYDAKYAGLTLSSQKPVSTWVKFRNFQYGWWGLAWTIWLSNQIISSSVLDFASMIMALVVPAVGSIVNVVFAILI